jgi:hypothetical protein
VLKSDISELKVGLSSTLLSRGPSGSVTKIINIKDVLSSSPSYTIVTQHNQIVSMNHLSEVKYQPIDKSQLKYHKQNYLVASPFKNEVLLAKKSQNLEKKKVYALNAAYVDTRSPIFSKESLATNTMSPLKTVKSILSINDSLHTLSKSHYNKS